MCNSYCNSCNYCVSQCTCTNPTLVNPATIPATGCISTNYARCIYYSGNNITCGITANNGENLDSVIGKIATAICNVTPADLNWPAFDYQCLRLDGSLTSSGPSDITTGQEFAEAVSIALCTLATAADITPNITVSGPCSTYFSGLTPGTSTLVDILDDFIVKLCDLNATNSTAGVTTACSAGVWTSVPAGGSTLGTWVNWIKTNVCSLVSGVQADITSLQTFQTNVETFVGDPSFSLIDNSTSCISGSGADDLLTTINLIKNKLCSINTTVSGLPNLSALTLPWSTCPGLFPTYGNTASLTTQLTRIVNEIAARSFSFSGDFTVSSTACGVSVSLASTGAPFTCSDLASCALFNIGDVNAYGLGTGATFNSTGLFWNSTATGWSAKKFAMTSSNGTCAISYVDDDVANTLTYNIQSNITATTTSNAGLLTPVSLTVGTPSAGTTPLTLEYNPNLLGGVGVPTTFAFAPAVPGTLTIQPSSVGPPSTLITLQAIIRNAQIFIEGQIDLVVAGAGLAAGTQYTLGTFFAPSAPIVTFTSWNSGYNIVDTATGVAVPVFVGYNANTLSIFTTAAVGTPGTYTLSLAGQIFSY